VEEPGQTGTGDGNPSPSSAPALSLNLGLEAGANEAGGAGVPAVPAPSATSFDLADYASLPPQPTGAPSTLLQALPSDCRLPCPGVARVGPASWYRDYRYGPAAQYAAIPGYTGGVVEGRANCATFPVTDSCQCLRHTRDERVVDLSPAAFVQFAPLSAGLVRVQITVLR